MNFGAVFREFISQSFDIENAVKSVAVNPCIFKRSQRLLAERATINQEQDAFETLRLDQAEHQGDGGTGFTGTGRHRQQDLLLAVNNGLLYRANGILLVITQTQFAHSGVIGKPLILFLRVAAQHIQQLFRAMPFRQRFRHIGGVADVAIPDTAFGLHCRAVFTPVGGVAKGDFKTLCAAGVLPANFVSRYRFMYFIRRVVF